jgi:hypothetical protein
MRHGQRNKSEAYEQQFLHDALPPTATQNPVSPVAVKQADGSLQGRAWRIGRDGLTPPM